MLKNMKLNKDILYIFDIFEKENYEIYLVGGCCRNFLINQIHKQNLKIHDYDFTTNVKPNDMINLFNKYNLKYIPTGIKHGTLTIIINNNSYEITTYRIDGKYDDNRHPNNVTFTNNLMNNLKRRDLTINAIAYNINKGYIDYFNGINDIKNKIIRTVGNANDRFKEDSLRMMRVIRFNAQLNFNIDYDTLNAIKLNKQLINNISKERIRDEINKILLSNNPQYIKKLYNVGIMDYIIPELSKCFKCEQNNPYHIYNVGDHIINSLKYTNNDLILRLILLFHDISKPDCKITTNHDHFYNHDKISSEISKKILKRLKYDNDTINKVSLYINYHDTRINEIKTIKRLMNKLNMDLFLKVRYADISSQNSVYFNERNNKILRIKKQVEIIKKQNECFQIKDLCINGKDIIDLGFKQGKIIGNILKDLLNLVMQNNTMNNKLFLINYINNNYIKE